MRGYLLRLVTLSTLFLAAACDQVDQNKGNIHLPEGDAANGQQEFVTLGCVNCHSVIGAELPEQAEAGPVRVLLGSKNRPMLSYGELVTSIVNPSHRISSRYRKDEISQDGQSIMTSYNDVMTIAQLADITAFLQKHYVKAERPGYRYPVFDYEAAKEAEAESSSD